MLDAGGSGPSRDQIEQPSTRLSLAVTGKIDHPGELLRPATAVGDGLGRDVMPVGSARGAVTALLSFRFPGPPAEPAVRLSPQRALPDRLLLGYAGCVDGVHGVGMR